MRINGWSRLLLVSAAAWALGGGGACAAGPRDAVAESEATARDGSGPRPETGDGREPHELVEAHAERPQAALGAAADVATSPPGGNAATQGKTDGPERTDEQVEAERAAQLEKVARTVGKVFLFILMVPLAILSSGGSVGFR
jgi:hypothetical protein